ncbi:MAG: lipoyl(octanoyl) transferase LipB [candidate division Zixibacteria bacterium]|nr:lipoyl(octanoyl) transferase LipB [candidate division Zixibacteria bacterium]
MPKIDIYIPGQLDYAEALDIQHRFVLRRAAGEGHDALILLEHNPVITFGRGGKEANILANAEMLEAKGVQLHKIERGGDVTYHGPGQLVGYIIIDMNNRGRDMHKFLRDIEEALIEVLKEFGLEAGRREGFTGAWVGNTKLAAIGVAVKRWISFHGFALNVSTDLSYFNLINPCGITDAPVGSISSLLDKQIQVGDVIPVVIDKFKEVFGYDSVVIYNNINID